MDVAAVNEPAPRARRNTSLLVGAGLGGALALLAVAWWAVGALSTLPPPDVSTASPAELTEFIVSDHGLAKLARYEQERFFTSWRAHFDKPENQRALKTHLATLPEDKIRGLRQAFFRFRKRQFLEEAQQYLALRSDREKGYKFLQDRLAEAAAEVFWLKGAGDPTRDLSGVLGSGLPRNPEDWTKLLVSETTPEERVLGEQYLNDLKQVREQERKKERVPTTQPA